jgi:hypothetical protein
MKYSLLKNLEKLFNGISWNSLMMNLKEILEKQADIPESQLFHLNQLIWLISMAFKNLKHFALTLI